MNKLTIISKYIKFKRQLLEYTRLQKVNKILNSNISNESKCFEINLLEQFGAIDYLFDKSVKVLRTFILPKLISKKMYKGIGVNLDADSLKEFNDRYEELQNRFEELKDTEGREEEKEQLINDVNSLKSDVEEFYNSYFNTDEDYGEEFPQEPSVNDQLINVDTDIYDGDNVEDFKPNYGDIIEEIDALALGKWQDWHDRYCKGQKSGRELKLCKAKGVDFALQELYKNENRCNETNDPKECKNSVKRLVDQWRQRKSDYYKG